jgi:hypothetical protein
MGLDFDDLIFLFFLEHSIFVVFGWCSVLLLGAASLILSLDVHSKLSFFLLA